MLDKVSGEWHRVPDFSSAEEPESLDLGGIERLDSLTSRQEAVMRLLAEGYVNKQIAFELEISVATVKVHIARAVERLGAKNRIHAVAMFVRSECCREQDLLLRA